MSDHQLKFPDRKDLMDGTPAKIRRWSITAVYALGILYVSTRDVNNIPTIPYLDKAVHFVMYAILAILCAWSLRSYLHYSWKRILGTSFLITTSYGILTEILQMFTPTRNAQLGDVVSNTAGALVGAWIAYMTMGRTSRGKSEVEDAD